LIFIKLLKGKGWPGIIQVIFNYSAKINEIRLMNKGVSSSDFFPVTKILRLQFTVIRLVKKRNMTLFCLKFMAQAVATELGNLKQVY
jgi:uncharacterized membrane protein YfbV (UPF0208 family)